MKCIVIHIVLFKLLEILDKRDFHFEGRLAIQGYAGLSQSGGMYYSNRIAS